MPYNFRDHIRDDFDHLKTTIAKYEAHFQMFLDILPPVSPLGQRGLGSLSMDWKDLIS